MPSPLPALAASVAAVAAVAAVSVLAKPAQDPSIARGRYLVTIGGCNDCHTPGYAQSGGTTYPANLRLRLAALDEDQWVHLAKNAQFRPPMPWFNLHRMSEADLRAIHRYVRALGPAGKPAPAYVPPEREASGPVVRFPGS